MLENTFRHVPGIGPALEMKLWNAGVHDWRGASDAEDLPVSRRRRSTLDEYLSQSAENLAAGNAGFFADLLPANQHWRLFREFRDAAAYLDIETTGLNRFYDYITTIALYHGNTIRHYVNGHGRDLERFKEDIRHFRVIVTYNGKSFDAPFIEDSLGVRLPPAHIDLRYVLAGLGYSGGLKECERRLGFERPRLEDVDGFLAVLLWNEYSRKRDPKALETLLAYNVEDTLTLERLMVLAYNEMLATTPFAQTHRLPPPATPPNPFTANPAVIP